MSLTKVLSTMVSFAPVSGITSTTVQGAIPESASNLSATLAAPTGSSLVGYLPAGTGAVATTVQTKLRESVSVKDFGIVSDGVTDQTAALVAYFSANSTYRGTVLIPYGTKFTKSTVYAAVPVGFILIDESSINTGQPPGYKNKSIRIYTNDTVSDDATFEIAASHHPTMRLNNLGTAGTSSATNYYHSIVRSAGFRWNNDPIDGMQQLTFKSPRGNLWRTSDVLNTSYDFAINYTSPWVALTVYAAGAKMNTSNNGVWSTVAGGTSASTEPTGTGPTYSDGTITWVYQGLWNAGSTRFFYDEDGYGGIAGSTTARWGAETATKKGCSINADESTGDTYLRDDQRNQDLIRRTTTKGVQLGDIHSLAYGGTISGATPTLSSSFHAVNNSGATNMTTLVLPSGQTTAFVTLYFSNANTTLKFTGGNFQMKGNVDATPPTAGVMQFLIDPTLSGTTWYEVSRNF
jgi:hypothetical protein